MIQSNRKGNSILGEITTCPESLCIHNASTCILRVVIAHQEGGQCKLGIVALLYWHKWETTGRRKQKRRECNSECGSCGANCHKDWDLGFQLHKKIPYGPSHAFHRVMWEEETTLRPWFILKPQVVLQELFSCVATGALRWCWCP